uniref:p300_1L n=1 Tax=African swine fever virus TaxID=10497 RepID=A0A6G7KU40_ASF
MVSLTTCCLKNIVNQHAHVENTVLLYHLGLRWNCKTLYQCTQCNGVNYTNSHSDQCKNKDLFLMKVIVKKNLAVARTLLSWGASPEYARLFCRNTEEEQALNVQHVADVSSSKILERLTMSYKENDEQLLITFYLLNLSTNFSTNLREQVRFNIVSYIICDLAIHQTFKIFYAKNYSLSTLYCIFLAIYYKRYTALRKMVKIYPGLKPFAYLTGFMFDDERVMETYNSTDDEISECKNRIIAIKGCYGNFHCRSDIDHMYAFSQNNFW